MEEIPASDSVKPRNSGGSSVLPFTFNPIVLLVVLCFGDECGPENYGQFGLLVFSLMPYVMLSGAGSCLLLTCRPATMFLNFQRGSATILA